ncbi:Hypothetical protein FKW44_020786 [Caligus rogercresseyi]|uniref:Uncharacterized protein n=1 Tax=Caligus rogercresseyi TaxID=217165 RepID=A0A7T8JVX4_CALRO|nr:Hypothetical protein FKW44_020786 [Caligus rogercresseyi]
MASASVPLVSHPNGAVVPADTPAIAHAKAQHFAAKGYPQGGVYAHGPAPYAHAPYAHPLPTLTDTLMPQPQPTPWQDIHLSWLTPTVPLPPLIPPKSPLPRLPMLPLEDPLTMLPDTLRCPPRPCSPRCCPPRTCPHGLAHHGLAHHGPAPYVAGYHGLVAHPNGAVVPVEAPENQAARAAHFAAHAKAY